jgi:hypothetical protein
VADLNVAAAMYRALFFEMKKFARAKNIPLDVPFRDLTEAQRDLIVEGEPKSGYSGVNGFFAWLERKKYRLHVRVFLSRYRGYAVCPECHGARLRPEARAVRLSGKSITEVCAMTVAQAREFVDHLELSAEQSATENTALSQARAQLDTENKARAALAQVAAAKQRILDQALDDHIDTAASLIGPGSVALVACDARRLAEAPGAGANARSRSQAPRAFAGGWQVPSKNPKPRDG